MANEPQPPDTLLLQGSIESRVSVLEAAVIALQNQPAGAVAVCEAALAANTQVADGTAIPFASFGGVLGSLQSPGVVALPAGTFVALANLRLGAFDANEGIDFELSDGAGNALAGLSGLSAPTISASSGDPFDVSVWTFNTLMAFELGSPGTVAVFNQGSDPVTVSVRSRLVIVAL